MIGVRGKKYWGGYEQDVAQVYISLDAGLARVRRPSEKGRPSRLVLPLHHPV